MDYVVTLECGHTIKADEEWVRDYSESNVACSACAQSFSAYKRIVSVSPDTAALPDAWLFAGIHTLRATNAAMLAALDDVRDYLDETLGDCDDGCECLRHIVNAAIAQARGVGTIIDKEA